MRRDGGFILVIVLGIVAVLASFAVAIASLSEASARVSRVERDFFERKNLEDSVFAFVAFKLLADRNPKWPKDGSVKIMKVEDQSVLVSVQAISGLVHLNRADENILAGLFSKDEMAGLLSLRPIRELSSIPRVVQPFVTVYGDHASLDPLSVPRKLLVSIPGVTARDADLLLDARRRGNDFIVESIVAKYSPLLDGKPSKLYRIDIEVVAHGGRIGFRNYAIVNVDAAAQPALQFVELGWAEPIR